MAHQRNNTLDILKLLASYMVVFIHVLFYGKIGEAFDALARFAVPLFFVVSGFYSYEITPKQIKKRIIHITQLLFLAVTVYILWKVIPLLVRQDLPGLTRYFCQYLRIKSILKLLVLNIPLFTTHLWYLFAILYVYIIYYFVVVFHTPKRFILPTSVLLLAIHIVLGEGLSVVSIAVPTPVVRNFALMGIPFFGLGLLANTYKQKLLSIPNQAIVILLMIGSLEAVISRYFFGKNELYVGSLFALLAFTVIFLKFPNIEYPPALISLASCSTYIYIFHPIVSEIMEKIYPILDLELGSSVFLQMIHPLLVCVMSTSLAYVLNKITNRLKV